MAKMTIADLRSAVQAFVAEAKQAGSWTNSFDDVSGLVEKVVRTIVLTGNFEDKLPELDAIERMGIIEEYAAGLVPASARCNDGTDRNSPARPVFDQPSYNYPLLNSNGEPGLSFKTTVDRNWYERYTLSGTEDELVNYIIKNLYDSFAVYKYAAKRQLIGNFINKACDAQAGETYTTNSTIIKCGHIYVQSSKFYIAKKNFSAAVNKSLATLKSEGDVAEITPDLVETVAIPEDTTTGEAFVKACQDYVEKVSIGETEGTSLSGSTIATDKDSLVMYLKPGVKSILNTQVEAGAFNPEKLGIPVKSIKVLPDFGTVDNSKVYAVIMDERGAKLFENYMYAESEHVYGSSYDNFWLQFAATAFISKHTAIHVLVDD